MTKAPSRGSDRLYLRRVLVKTAATALAFVLMASSALAAPVSCPGSNFTRPVVQVSGNACFFTLIQPMNTEIHYSVNNVIQSENSAPITDVISAEVAPNPDSIPPSATVVAYSQNSVSGTTFFNPQPTLPNQYSAGIGNINNLGPWALTITSGNNVVTTTTPSLAGAITLPFVSSMTISGGGLTPTFDWTVPAAASQASLAHVTIYDLSASALTPQGNNSRILDANVPISADTYTVNPANFGQGVSQLYPGHNYSVAIQLVQTRSSGSFLSQSWSFFNFQVLPPGSPTNVQLPMVKLTATGPQYQFHTGSFVAGEPVFIDPQVATGYIYETGATDPNFASVELPNIGNLGPYDLYLWNGSAFVFDTMLAANTMFDFGLGGVSEFEVLGIDPNLGLDPENTTAFITELTFVSTGNFTGTMTPITTNVSEPGSLALLVSGLLGVGLIRRRKAL